MSYLQLKNCKIQSIHAKFQNFRSLIFSTPDTVNYLISCKHKL